VRCETHPVVIKHPATNLGENVASCRFECGVDVGTALRTRLDEEQAFFLRPSLPFLRWHLPPLDRQVALVAHEDACQVRVRMCAHVGKPGARVFEACSDGVGVSVGHRVGRRRWKDVLGREVTS